MKKKLFLAFFCIITVLACEIPQSLTIKGKPGLYIPLGSPFNKLGPGERLEDYLTLEKIREMMGSEDSEVVVYDYRGSDIDANVQAYLAHYPIARMPLDLQEYVDEALVNDNGESLAIEIPQSYSENETWQSYEDDPDYHGELYLDGEEGIRVSEGEPTFKIELVDMARLVKKVDGTFGFETPYLSSLDNLEVYIPAFGFAGYKQGIQEGDMLQFLEENTTIHPQTDLNVNDGFLYIYIKMTGPCSGVIDPGIVFDWTEATIDTEDENFEGEYPIGNSLKEFLGSGVNFKEVKGYIYVDGIGEEDDASLILEHIHNETADGLAAGDLEPKAWQPVVGDTFVTPLSNLPHSYIDAEHIDLTDVLNSGEASSLKYQILIKEMEIENDGHVDKVISADLVVLIIMDFDVSDEDPPFEGYSKLDFGGVLPDLGDKDLFSRKGTDDDLLNNVEKIKISLIKIEKGSVDGEIAMLVVNPDHNTGKADRHVIDFNSPDPSLTLKMDEVPFPFTPKFELLLKNKNGEDYAELKIKRQEPGYKPFDFSLTVEARTDINYTLAF